jgi:hypothetical protein
LAGTDLVRLKRHFPSQTVSVFSHVLRMNFFLVMSRGSLVAKDHYQNAVEKFDLSTFEWSNAMIRAKTLLALPRWSLETQSLLYFACPFCEFVLPPLNNEDSAVGTLSREFFCRIFFSALNTLQNGQQGFSHRMIIGLTLAGKWLTL